MGSDTGNADRPPLDLPADLPVPVDDGAADHLTGAAVPPVALAATDSTVVDLSAVAAAGRVVLYAYPRTAPPGEPSLVPDWDQIPGARGCTPEACSFRDAHEQIRAAGTALYGLSTQDTDFQREVVQRLGLPFPLLSDADLRLTRAMRLPTFAAAGQTLLKRLTMVLRDGMVEKVWYPVFPPDRHADEVLAWLTAEK
jgi:peroxiredoxin